MKPHQIDALVRLLVVIALLFTSLPHQAIAAALTTPEPRPSATPQSRERVSTPLPSPKEWPLAALADVPFVGEMPTRFPRWAGTQPRFPLTPANPFEPLGFDTLTWAEMPSLLPRPRAVPSPNAPQPAIAPSTQPQPALLPLTDQQVQPSQDVPRATLNVPNQTLSTPIFDGWLQATSRLGEQPTEVVTLTTPTTHTIFLPLVSRQPPIQVTGLAFIPPSGWTREEGAQTPPTSTQIADADFVRFLSPDGTYRLEANSDWATTPQPPFGNLAIPVDPFIASLYDESVTTLADGTTLVQVLRAKNDPSPNQNILLVHAAFYAGHVSYSLAIYGNGPVADAWQTFQALLPTVVPHPQEVPTSTRPLAEVVVERPAEARLQRAQQVTYDRQAAVQYANYWTRVAPLSNSDGCYLWTDGSSLQCTFFPGANGVDGAHFINMALQAGGLPVPPLWAGEALRIQDLRAWLLNNGASEVTDPAQLEPGDVVFVGTNGCWGWGGVVVNVDSQGPLINVHSWVSNGQTSDRADLRHTQLLYNNCGPTNQYSFVHIDAPFTGTLDTEPPVIHFVDRQISANGQTLFSASVTDNVAVDRVYLVFDGVSRLMTPNGDRYMALQAGGLPVPPLWAGEALRIQDLRAWLLNNGASEVTDPAQLEPGDVVFVGTNGCWGWGGVVVNVDSQGPLINVHSWVSNGQTSDRADLRHTQLLYNNCGPTNQYSFVHIDAPFTGTLDTEPPVIHFVDRQISANGQTLFSASVTDNVAVDRVYLVFDGVSRLMTPNGDRYEAVVPLPRNQISTWRVIAVDTSGNAAAFPPGQPITLTPPARPYNLGLYNLMDAPKYNSSAARTPYTYDPLGRASGADQCNPGPQGCAADPINTANGNFVQNVVDLIVPGIGDTDIVVERTYNTRLGEPLGRVRYTLDGTEVRFEPVAVHPEPFGAGWTPFFGMSIVELDDALLDGVQVRYPDGHAVDFRDNGDGTFSPVQPRVYDTLRVQNGGYLLQTKEQRTYLFDADGRLTRIEDRNGNFITFTYTNGRLTRIENSAGRWVELAYTGDGLIREITAPEGVRLRYAYDNGRLRFFTDARGQTTEYVYDADGRLTTIISPNGYPTLRLSYDAVGRAVEQIIGASERRTLTYDDANRAVTITDALGNQTVHVYDAQDRLVEVRNALGGVRRFTYDAQNHLTSVEDEAGRTWTFTYDAQGNRLSQTGPLGARTTFEYDSRNLPVRIRQWIDATRVQETTFTYDARGNLTRLCNALGDCATFTLDGRGLPTAWTDFAGNQSVATYDAAGNLTALTDPEGNTTTFAYDALGRLTETTTPLGHRYTFTYDPGGNLLRLDGPLGYSERYQYDANGNLVSATDPNGGTTTYEYDASDRLVRATDPLGRVMTFSYDAMGNLVAFQDAAGRTWQYTYNALFWLTGVQGPQGYTVRLAYDAVGNVTDVRDPAGRVTHAVYDDLDRPTTMIFNERPGFASTPDTNVTEQYEYDLLGNVVRALDANGNATHFTYDLLGRLVEERDALGRTWRYAYDANGNLTAVVDARGFRTTLRYDRASRLVEVEDPLGGRTTFAYDADGNVVEAVDPRGVVTRYEYDALGRQIAVVENAVTGTPPDAETNVRTEYAYDPAGNLIRLTNPRGYTTTLAYDAAYRLVQVTDALGGVTRLEYDAADNVIAVVDALGRRTTFTYDDLDRLITTEDPGGHVERFVYDIVGNLRFYTNARGATTEFRYDALDRLTAVVDALGQVTTFTYDAVGNLLSWTNRNGATETYTYDAGYRLVNVIDALGNQTTYEYDANDNLTAVVDANGHRTTFAYDALDRLVDVTNAEGETPAISTTPWAT